METVHHEESPTLKGTKAKSSTSKQCDTRKLTSEIVKHEKSTTKKKCNMSKVQWQNKTSKQNCTKRMHKNAQTDNGPLVN